MAVIKRQDSLVPVGFWNPSGMIQEMERMFDDFRLGIGDMPFRSSGSRMPSVDVRDEDGQYVVEAELPGIKKEEVSVEIGDEAVIIKAEKENNVESRERICSPGKGIHILLPSDSSSGRCRQHGGLGQAGGRRVDRDLAEKGGEDRGQEEARGPVNPIAFTFFIFICT